MKALSVAKPAPFIVSHFFEWQYIGDTLLDSMLAEFADNGAEALTTATVWSNRILGEPAFAVTLRKKLASHGLVMRDAHAPWSLPWDLDIEDDARRPHMIAGHRLCMSMLADLGVRTYTMHIGAAPNYTNGGVHTDDLRERSFRTLESLLPTAESLGMIIAVENAFEPSNTPEEVAGCIRHFNSPHIACCLDIGHAHIMDAGAPRAADAIHPGIREKAWNGRIVLKPFAETVSLLAPWIVTCHVHDNDGTSDQHLLPGDGNTDWPAYMAELRQCPRLESIQNETNPCTRGTSIARGCRVFRDLAGLIR